MADSVVKYALLAGAGFVAWRWWNGQAAAVTPAPAPGGTPAPPAPPAAGTGYNSLAALLGRMTAASGATASTKLTPDEWDNVMTSQGGPVAPDPIALFGNRDPMTLAQYWAGMSDWLAKNKGLTGLGVYSSLGRIAASHRGGW